MLRKKKVQNHLKANQKKKRHKKKEKKHKPTLFLELARKQWRKRHSHDQQKGPQLPAEKAIIV